MKNILGERIRKRMKERGVTQEELAAVVGVGQSQISRVLAGERGTDILVIKNIAAYLKESQQEYVNLYADIPMTKRDVRRARIYELIDQIDDDRDLNTIEGVATTLVPDKKVKRKNEETS
jgi:transcriptional regulator with XRE-family HTH domain